MLTDFGRVLLFFIVAAVFVAAGLIVAWLVRPKRWYPGKLTTYECGEDPVGFPWVKYNIRFYVVGYASVWAKGNLEWDRPEPYIPIIR